eukprot:GDKK01072554.1.p1 GENE.GDKK01072554.1~~GDKK01072554.1.p1  ORF type:complete len:779 (+),score=173.05 GDKK01072554.1:187-2337(+)
MSGASMNPLLMQVVQHCLHTNNKHVKRLMQLFWEVIDKLNADGQPKEELLLICESLRSDITSHNEYVRGSTLRTLCKITCWNVIEPLVDDIFENLKHSHAYVRRNAVMCVYSLYENFNYDVSDAVEIMENLISIGTDIQSKRNALLFLGAVAPEKAIEYVLHLAQEREKHQDEEEPEVEIIEVQENASVGTDTIQLAILSLCKRAVSAHPELRNTLLREVMSMAEDEHNPSVAFEGCNALMALTANKQAVNTAVKMYLRLLTCQSDNNIRLLVLDRLAALITTQSSVIEAHLEDLLRFLETPHTAIRKKILEMSLKVLTRSSVTTFVSVLRKHLMDTTKNTDALSKQDEHNVEFRRILARCMHLACSMHPEAAASVVHVLLDLFAETDAATSSEVILMIRELVCRAPQLRNAILTRIVSGLNEMYQSIVLRVALWLLGEYTAVDSEQGTPESDAKSIEALEAIVNTVGTAPFLPTSGERGNNCNIDIRDENVSITTTKTGSRGSQPALTQQQPLVAQTRTVVLPDGSYGTETYYNTPNTVNPSSADAANDADAANVVKGTLPNTSLRKFIQYGDWLVAAVTCQTIGSLMVRATSKPGVIPAKLRQDAVLVVANITKFARDDSSAGAHADVTLRCTQTLQFDSSSEDLPNRSTASTLAALKPLVIFRLGTPSSCFTCHPLLLRPRRPRSIRTCRALQTRCRVLENLILNAPVSSPAA